MEKIKNFLDKYGMIIIVCILLVVFIQQCSIKSNAKKLQKYQKELVMENNRRDSIMYLYLENMNHKLDSTLISNGAVISANKQTSEAINNKKQNIIIKMDKE